MKSNKTISRRVLVSVTISVIRLGITAALMFSLLISTSQVHARCEDGQQEVATLFVEDARANNDDIEKLVLLKQSLKACPDFVNWLELGKVQLALDNSLDAAHAFENARDFYTPDENGSFTANQIKRRAIGNAWLAEVYQREGELASASVATQEASHAFRSLNQHVPQRLNQLQALIDDAMADADASVLARSFQLQHERATRGIGIRPAVRDNQETIDEIVETEQLEADYSGESVAVTVAETSIQQSDSFSSGSVSDNNTQNSFSESRLNIPVLFAYDSAELSTSSQATVKQLGAAIDALNLNSSATVIVVGHTDSSGAANYNQQLSMRRANTVMLAMQKLVQVQVNFESIGLGEQELRYIGNTKDDHRRNRRVEIIVRR